MTSLRMSRDAVDDLALTDDYAAEKLRLEMTTSTSSSQPRNDDGLTRLRPPPPPVVASDPYHVCPYSGGGRTADTVDLVATPIYCPSSRRLGPVRSTEYVFSAPSYPRTDSVCSRTCVQLAYEAPSRPGVSSGVAAGSAVEHAQRRPLGSFGVAST